MVVVDRSDPADLQQLAWTDDGREGISVAVGGDVLYLGMGTAGVAVYDVSDPAQPAFVRAFDTPGSANGFAVAEGRLYVADGNNASGPDFRIYGLSDPLDPALLGTLEAGAFVTSVSVSGGTAYLTGGFGLLGVDVMDPAAPEVFYTEPLSGTTYEVAFVEDDDPFESFVLVAGLDGVFILGAGIPSGPLLYSTYDAQQALGVAVVDRTPLVSDRFRGLHVLDVSDPGEPVQTALARNGGFSARGTFANGPDFGDALLYVTDLAGALRIFSVSGVPFGDAQARLLSVTDVPPNAQEVEVRGDRAYVTDADNGGTGLTILDVSDPAAPTLLGSYASPNQAFGLDVVGTTVYLCNGFSGLVVLDASDPASITELGSFAFAANANDVVVDAENEVAYVVSFGGGMRSLDVSDPANITELDAEAWGFLNAVSLSFPTDVFGFSPLYVADGQQGLRVVDTSDPADLTTLGTVATASQARDVAGSGDFFDDGIGSFANVADDFYGLRVFDRERSLFAAFESADRGFGVAVNPGADGLGLLGPLVLMSGETGVYVFNAPYRVAAEDAAPETALLLASRPNPTSDATQIAFSLLATGKARLEAFDMLGRRVAVLQNGLLPAGEYERTFDASALPSGVYVLRLQTAAGTATARVTVIR